MRITLLIKKHTKPTNKHSNTYMIMLKHISIIIPLFSIYEGICRPMRRLLKLKMNLTMKTLCLSNEEVCLYQFN